MLSSQDFIEAQQTFHPMGKHPTVLINFTSDMTRADDGDPCVSANKPILIKASLTFRGLKSSRSPSSMFPSRSQIDLS